MYVNEYIKPELNGLIWIINPYENGWMTLNTGFNKACFAHGTGAPSRSPALKSDAPGIPLGSNSNDKSPIILKMGRYIISGVMGVPQSHPMVDHRFPEKKSYMFIHELWRARRAQKSSAKPRSSSRVAALVHKLEP